MQCFKKKVVFFVQNILNHLWWTRFDLVDISSLQTSATGSDKKKTIKNSVLSVFYNRNIYRWYIATYSSNKTIYKSCSKVLGCDPQLNEDLKRRRNLFGLDVLRLTRLFTSEYIQKPLTVKSENSTVYMSVKEFRESDWKNFKTITIKRCYYTKVMCFGEPNQISKYQQHALLSGLG